MTIQQHISETFERLIEEGQRVISNAGWDGKNFRRWPAADEYFRFRTQAMNLVRRVCGNDSDHYQQLKRLAEEERSGAHSRYIVHCLGVVQAAKLDFDTGLLFDLRALIVADVLGDFVEQAEQLLVASYYVPAASLAGAVLEDTLRKLCDKHGIPVPASTKIDRLNADLAKSNVYDKLIQKRITALADIRNNADHGHFDKFRKEDVEDMIRWIRRFTADYLK